MKNKKDKEKLRKEQKITRLKQEKKLNGKKKKKFC